MDREEMPAKIDDLIVLAENIIAFGRNITYPSRASSRYVRSVMTDLVATIRVLRTPAQQEASGGPWRLNIGQQGSGPWDRTTIETSNGDIVVVVAVVDAENSVAAASARLLVERANAASSPVVGEREGIIEAVTALAQRNHPMTLSQVIATIRSLPLPPEKAPAPGSVSVMPTLWLPHCPPLIARARRECP
jgi:hypothetical protein